MNLHENEQLFEDAVIATAQKLKIPEIYIEKDYWITVALYAIFHSPKETDAVFKGGTALAKCHKLISRFSEDIDIVVLKRQDDSPNKLKGKLKAVTQAVNNVMPEIDSPGVTNKFGMIRKTAHRYVKKNFKGLFGEIREDIIIEASWLGSSEPYIQAEVSCFIYEMMVDLGQNDLIKTYNMQPFTVKVLSKERTFCEKIMSLVRFSHTENPYQDLSKKMRHIFDLNQMLKNDEVNSFLNSQEFEKMLLLVGNDDLQSFKNNNQWLNIHPKEAIIFKNTEETWGQINKTYKNIFSKLVIGELPEESDLIETLKMVNEKLIPINWTIKI